MGKSNTDLPLICQRAAIPACHAPVHQAQAVARPTGTSQQAARDVVYKLQREGPMGGLSESVYRVGRSVVEKRFSSGFEGYRCLGQGR